MLALLSALLLNVVASLASPLGTECTAPLGAGLAAPSDPFWMETIEHQGISAFNPSPSTYKVFRNVKEFGAKGDGVTDDTEAINAAITAGTRCGLGTCQSSTLTPAVVYFPQGTYVISAPIIAYYYTQLIGDARVPPTILAAPSFNGIALIDANPYIATGQFYHDTLNFFRSVRNMILDLRQIPAANSVNGLHWQVSQATSLINLVVHMSTDPSTNHQGMFMESGSGGYMGDMIVNGGKVGLWVGNQQFTVRNVTINNAQTGILMVWNWGWTYQSVNMNNCGIGFDVNQGAGHVGIIDSVITDTPIAVRTAVPSTTLVGSIVINNMKLINSAVAVGIASDSSTLLAGGTTTIASWGQGNAYHGTNSTGAYTQGPIASAHKPPVLLDSSGKIFGRTHPQYADYAPSQFVSVRDHGAMGDGQTDDTAAIKDVFTKFAGCKIIFFDAGTYIVSSTITIPAGSKVVGEAWTTIAGKGPAFASQFSPTPIVQVGSVGSIGTMEITDMLFMTVGPAGGAIVVEWNIKQSWQGAAGMWDSHIRLAGADGTNLQETQCPKDGSGGTANCLAAYLALHLTPLSSAYLEGTWVWLADHNIDGDGTTQITVYSGRGILSQSQGPVWLIGTAEHHVLYQYNLVGASNHYLGLIQTETPYFQPSPHPPAPFMMDLSIGDPIISPAQAAAWGLRVANSVDIIVFGAGLYSFFQQYNSTCETTNSCQNQIATVDSISQVTIYGLSTVASTYQLSVNQQGVINQSSNSNGFESTVTVWSKN